MWFGSASCNLIYRDIMTTLFNALFNTLRVINVILQGYKDQPDARSGSTVFFNMSSMRFAAPKFAVVVSTPAWTSVAVTTSELSDWGGRPEMIA